MEENTNELWKLETGYIAGYTEDKDLIKRIKRYKTKKGWHVMAEYFNLKTNSNKRIAVQFKIPAEQRRSAERMFQTKLKKY